jgi:predicted enzyme related to lactoylglutathione lyase
METRSERIITQVEIRSRNLKRSAAFYKDVFDWKVYLMEPGYAIVDTGLPPIASIWENRNPQFPLGLCNNVTVDDCQKEGENAIRLGGKVYVQKHEVPNSGWFVGTRDPWGNDLYFWQPITPGSPQLTGPRRNPFVLWEISTPDLPQAIAYYSNLLGWMFGGVVFTFNYALTEGVGLQRGVALVGGPLSNRARGTVNYVAVDDLVRAAARVREAGGWIVNGPGDLPGEGRYFIFEDLDRNRMGVLQPG